MPKESSKTKKMRPANSPEAREQRCISMAYDRAEEKLANGTASSQLITHFLKLGSEKTQREIEKLKSENDLLQAKVDDIKAGNRMEELYSKAISALMGYRGEEINTEESEENDL